MVKYVTGTLAGGLVAYAWAMFAWAVLPFNMSHFSNVKDEKQINAVITRSMPERGIYLLPGMPDTSGLDNLHNNGVQFLQNVGADCVFLKRLAHGILKVPQKLH